jgi:hypothetical protein
MEWLVELAAQVERGEQLHDALVELDLGYVEALRSCRQRRIASACRPERTLRWGSDRCRRCRERTAGWSDPEGRGARQRASRSFSGRRLVGRVVLGLC